MQTEACWRGFALGMVPTLAEDSVVRTEVIVQVEGVKFNPRTAEFGG